jgi:tRNA-2-methylthio-N6-dimethylallyladenosine synthase
MSKKVHIKSFGCQMNKLDTSLVLSSLKKQGYELSESATDADVVLLNTCSVRENAERRVFSHLGHLKHIKETRPNLIVVVFGCMAQRLGSELLEHRAVDIVAGPGQIPQIPELIKQSLETKGQSVAVTEKIRQGLEENQSKMLENFETENEGDDSQIPGQGFIRAMRGCNKFCTYCIVPYVRGPEVSRPVSAIIEQARNMANEGIKQITILGQTINLYRHEETGKVYTLAELLHEISKVDGIEWVRFITSHPAEFEDSVLYAIAENPKICPYLHIPAQSGSNEILKQMNRNYTVEHYTALLERARNIVPGISISSDFIVGFPGETDEDFRLTAELIKKARFKNSFIFKYSQRPGTTAEKRLEDSVPEEIKQQRNLELLEIQNEICAEDSRKLLNQQVRVLVEGLSRKPHVNSAEFMNNPQLIGRTSNDYIVVFNGPASLAGNFATVKVTRTTGLTMFGELIYGD